MVKQAAGEKEERRKGWVEAEYERHKRMRRKSSGNCILEVKDSETGEETKDPCQCSDPSDSSRKTLALTQAKSRTASKVE